MRKSPPHAAARKTCSICTSDSNENIEQQRERAEHMAIRETALYLETFLLDFVMGRATQGDQRIEGVAFLHFFEATVPLWKVRVSDA